MGEIRVALGDEGQLIDVSRRIFSGTDSRRAHELRRQIDPVLSVPIKPVYYRDVKSAYREGDGYLELERADTGARVAVLIIALAGDSSNYCFVGVVDGQVVTVVVDQAYDKFIYDGGPTVKAYNWPASAAQINVV